MLALILNPEGLPDGQLGVKNYSNNYLPSPGNPVGVALFHPYEVLYGGIFMIYNISSIRDSLTL